ncbi:hypothetical protein BZA77DRAFT_292151 [Pyronema omphalodes]|nr:hypothetical protein BZA77DRAFT_292151 [Pyronema omphalodes]
MSFLWMLWEPCEVLGMRDKRDRRKSTGRLSSFCIGIIVSLYARGASMGGHTMGEMMYEIRDKLVMSGSFAVEFSAGMFGGEGESGGRKLKVDGVGGGVVASGGGGGSVD